MRWLALLVSLWLVTGCGAVAGADDVELTYELVDAPKAGARFGEDLRALVLQRLGAARIGADVTEQDRRISIVVAEELTSTVDELVTWSGTLRVYETDPAYALPPRPELTPEGEGGRAAVVRAVQTFGVDADHRLLAEPTWQGDRWRTRVVLATPIGELADGALVGWGEGATLRVRAAPGSPAEQIVQRARGASVVVARGPISFGTPAVEPNALALAFGAGAEAYARVQYERHLLMTSRLPPLRRVDAVGLPPNRVLGAACIVVPLVLSMLWLLFVRRFDRAHPEPMWLVTATFFLGSVSTVPAGLLEYGFTRLSPWLDPSLVTFGGQLFAFPLAFAVFTLVVGLSEEGAKRLAAHFAVRRPEFDEPVDGIVYGIVASLGFAAAENVRYFAIGRLAAPLVIARCFMSVPAHMFFGALWGYALGARLIDPRKRVWGWLLASAACHGLFDTLLSTEGASGLAVLLNMALASAFVVLVRRALRHGVVTKDMAVIPEEERRLFRVGQPTLFWVSAVALHVFALGIFVLGAWYQLARHRPSTLFVLGSSVLLVLLAVAALGVSSALPLDVAVDAYGVTFAGAARSWRKIRGYARTRDRIDLACEAGPIRLGPAPPERLDEIAAALDAKLARREHTLESA